MFKAIKKFAFCFFSSGNEPPETQDSHIKLPGELEPSAEWLIKEAYTKIMKNIEASDEFKAAVLNTLIEFQQTGGGSRLFKRSIIENNLILENWIWPEFDQWYKIFKKANDWPYGWTENIYKEPDLLPTSVEDSLHYLTVQEIKTFLKEHKLTPKPMPKNRVDWETTFCNNVDWELLQPLIIEKYAVYRDQYLERRKIDKLNLLFGFLVACIHSCLRYYQLKDLMQDPIVKKTRRLIASGSNEKLKIEKDFIEKFNNGEISEYPPYFPGCSIRIFSERRKK